MSVLAQPIQLGDRPLFAGSAFERLLPGRQTGHAGWLAQAPFRLSHVVRPAPDTRTATTGSVSDRSLISEVLLAQRPPDNRVSKSKHRNDGHRHGSRLQKSAKGRKRGR
jgi:hypothetical protein